MLLVGAFLLAIFVLDSPWSIVVVVVAAFVELAEVIFWLFYSKRQKVQVGVETLIGSRAQVVEPCFPEGQVRLQGELWRARCETGARTGDQVRVTGREDLLLVVEPEG